MKRIITIILCLFILQTLTFALGGKTYHRIALDKLNAKLKYLEKNLKKWWRKLWERK